MATLAISKKFKANHGSAGIRNSEFRVEISFKSSMINGFIGGIDYDIPKKRLTELLDSLDNQYVDDIVGRATNENIALYLLNELSDIPIDSIKLYENDEQYVEISRSEIDFDNFPALLRFNKAQSFLLRCMPEKAIQELNKSLEIKPDSAEAYNLRGRCQKYLGKYDLALPDYLKAIQIKPDFAEAHRNLGNAYYYLEMTDLMIPAFSKAIELMPKSALAYNNRGFAYQKLSKFELALRDHNRAIEIDPNYAEAYNDRAVAYEALGEKDFAEKDRCKANELLASGKNSYSGIFMY